VIPITPDNLANLAHQDIMELDQSVLRMLSVLQTPVMVMARAKRAKDRSTAFARKDMEALQRNSVPPATLATLDTLTANQTTILKSLYRSSMQFCTKLYLIEFDTQHKM